MIQENVAAIVLAAGKGSRMHLQDAQNKVSLQIAGKAMVEYTVDTLQQLALGQVIVVIGQHKESVLRLFSDNIDFVEQAQPLGTGHAVACALSSLKPQIKYVLVVYGDDSAFFPKEVLQEVITMTQTQSYAFTFLSLAKQDPTSLGRVIRDSHGKVKAIVEEKNATPKQKRINEVNLGGFCFKREFLEASIPLIAMNPISHEYYLTDLVDIALKQGEMVEAICLDNEDYWQGVNTEEDLKLADQKMKKKLA